MTFPVAAKKEFFTKPTDLKPGYGTTVTEEGHIYGYLALWNVRLIGSGRKNTKPPKSKSGYSYANSFNYKTAEGDVIRTGVLSGDGGHHWKGDFKRTQKAYADISTKIANVVYGEDEHGVWFSGALSHRVDEALAQDIRSSGVSGHWERPHPRGNQELLGACCVNIPGFAQEADHRIVASATMTPGGGILITHEIDNGESSGAKMARQNVSISSPGGITAAANRLVPIEGTLAVLETETPDKRQVNNVTWDRLPLPLWSSMDNMGGHWGAKVIGHITDIQVNGSLVTFSGMVEETSMVYDETETASDLDILGVSMDGYAPEEDDLICEYDEWGWPIKYTFENYKIVGATLTLNPAFEQTVGVKVNGSADEGAPPDDEVEDDVNIPAPTGDTEEAEAVAASANVATLIKLPVKWQ